MINHLPGGVCEGIHETTKARLLVNMWGNQPPRFT